MLAINVARRVVVKNEHEAGQPCQSGGAEMGQVWNSGHLNFDRNRYLSLDLFGAPAWPLGDDLYIVVRHVGIGFHGQVAKRNDSPRSEYHDATEDQPTIFQRKVDECANHLTGSPQFPAAMRWSRPPAPEQVLKESPAGCRQACCRLALRCA